MKASMKKLMKYTFFALVVVLFAAMPVFAETSGDINFCDYSGTVRAFKIAGLVMKITCTVVPIILMIVTIVSISKTILSGDSGDISKHVSTFVKRTIAGFAVFMIPVLFDFVFNELVSYDTNKYQTCTVCLFDPGNCQIPETDPDYEK